MLDLLWTSAGKSSQHQNLRSGIAIVVLSDTKLEQRESMYEDVEASGAVFLALALQVSVNSLLSMISDVCCASELSLRATPRITLGMYIPRLTPPNLIDH